jgi:UDP-N-acetylmuramoyl-tripeptide--D-alanyl-D-alanine ligase
MAERTKARVITYGLSPGSDVRGLDLSSAWPERLALTVCHRSASARVQTQLVGEFWVTAVLGAITCGIACGVSLADCASAIASVAPRLGRYSVHQVPGGPVFLFDHKASIWTIPLSLKFLVTASAPRKTLVLGTLADYPGAAGPRYRRIAREALKASDRVVFVGPQAARVDRLREGEPRLFAFATPYEATEFFDRTALKNELILLKGSIAVDHLERIMLSQNESVVCWKVGCGFKQPCSYCPDYRTLDVPAALVRRNVKA